MIPLVPSREPARGRCTPRTAIVVWGPRGAPHVRGWQNCAGTVRHSGRQQLLPELNAHGGPHDGWAPRSFCFLFSFFLFINSKVVHVSYIIELYMSKKL